MAKQKTTGGRFHVEFKSPAQKKAWEEFQEKDVLFLMGTAGCGKTHIAMAFAVNEILTGKKKRIVVTRPIVEAGESLGFLPGDFHEKTGPYFLPLYDCLTKMVGKDGTQRELLEKCIEVRPLAYMRGLTFDDAVCIFDEAQNATVKQLKLFLTRFGENSKIIVTGDPTQSDISDSGLEYVAGKLEALDQVGVVDFPPEGNVRHPLVAKISSMI